MFSLFKNKFSTRVVEAYLYDREDIITLYFLNDPNFPRELKEELEDFPLLELERIRIMESFLNKKSHIKVMLVGQRDWFYENYQKYDLKAYGYIDDIKEKIEKLIK